MKSVPIICFVLFSIISMTKEQILQEEKLNHTNVFLINTHYNKSTIEELLLTAEVNISSGITNKETTKPTLILQQMDFHKSIELDDEKFGYGYALIVFFVVLLITIFGIKTLTYKKITKEGTTPENSGDYLLFDLKDQETDIATVI